MLSPRIFNRNTDLATIAVAAQIVFSEQIVSRGKISDGAASGSKGETVPKAEHHHPSVLTASDHLTRSGTALFHGKTFEIFPAGALGPYRIEHSGDAIRRIVAVDPDEHDVNPISKN